MSGESKKPKPVHDVYEALWQEVAGLHYSWDLYQKLYLDNEARTVLNKTAPGTFRTVERAIRTEIVMSLSRLTDPPASFKRDNLSLEHLINVVKEHSDEAFVAALVP